MTAVGYVTCLGSFLHLKTFADNGMLLGRIRDTDYGLKMHASYGELCGEHLLAH
jgi:hypothetical protein